MRWPMTSAPRLALQYSLLFAANGVTLPFIGLWLKAQGLTGKEIGVLLALPMFGRVVTGPALAVWADGFKHRRTPIALLGLVMALGYGGAGLVEGFWLWALFWFIGATAAAALIPLGDVLTLKLARREGFAFAFPRGFGSAAFVVANVAMGWWLTKASTDAIILWSAAVGVLIAFTAWKLLPTEPVHEGSILAARDRFRGIGDLLRDKVFLTAIFAVGTITATHGFYYGFSAIAWKAQGISETTTGLLWAFSVVVEIAFMWVIEPWRRRMGIGPWLVLMIGAAAAVVRWSLLAFAPPLWALWPLQSLHALTFAATYLAGVEIVERLSPANSHTAAQTMASVLSGGLLIGLATAVSGPLYDSLGLMGYLAMTAMAVIGAVAGLRLKPALKA